jgi:hypothetical protein
MANRPLIQEKAIIALGKTNPMGEAPRRAAPVPSKPMEDSERHDMVARLQTTISDLMHDAENTYQANCYNDETQEFNPDYITRLSTNEFFFFTKEPLSLQEFETVQNQIAEKAKNTPAGVQLILSSFAVKTKDNKVMNVTAHITCGDPPTFNFIVKSNTSPIDVRYKIANEQGDISYLDVLDKMNSNALMPQIKVNGREHSLSFNNIIECKTPGGTPFVTAIDVCLDHRREVARQNFDTLSKSKPYLLSLPFSYVVVANTINLAKKLCLGSDVLHVDPLGSQKQCKPDVPQRAGEKVTPVFGSEFITYEVDKSLILPITMHHLKSNYSYETEKRGHSLIVDAKDFTNLKKQYLDLKGDLLKNKILTDFKNQIENTSSKSELQELKKQLVQTSEYKVLATSQDWFTEKTAFKTSSVKAFEKMFKEQEANIKRTKTHP